MIPEIQNPIPDAKQILVPVSAEKCYADYLAELTTFLPYSISQYGLVLTSALALQQDPKGHVRSKDPNQREEDMVNSTIRPPHYRTTGMPLAIAGAEANKTVVDWTISGHAVTFFPRCQKQLVDAVIEDAKQSGENVEGSKTVDVITAANTLRFLTKESTDPVLLGHDQNVRTMLSSVFAQLQEFRLGECKQEC